MPARPANWRFAPRFYNTLTANCTTIVWQLARRIGQALPTDWRLLASGYLPEYLRDVGGLASMQPLELQRARKATSHSAPKLGKHQRTAQIAERSADFRAISARACKALALPTQIGTGRVSADTACALHSRPMTLFSRFRSVISSAGSPADRLRRGHRTNSRPRPLPGRTPQ